MCVLPRDVQRTDLSEICTASIASVRETINKQCKHDPDFPFAYVDGVVEIFDRHLLTKLYYMLSRHQSTCLRRRFFNQLRISCDIGEYRIQLASRNSRFKFHNGKRPVDTTDSYRCMKSKFLFASISQIRQQSMSQRRNPVMGACAPWLTCCT